MAGEIDVGYYPIFLDLKDRPCLVVGGGEVAERKVKSLLECEAKVKVVAPQATKGLKILAAEHNVTLHIRQYQDDDLEGIFLAVAATDDVRVNEAVSAEAKRRRVLVNVVDDPARCDFIVPSVVRSGEVSLAISTGGLSPALARRLRQQLEAFLGPEYGELAQVLSEVRRQLKAAGRRVSPEAWQAALGEEVIELVRRGQAEAARNHIWSALTLEHGR